MASPPPTQSSNAPRIRELIEGFRSSPMNVRLDLTKAILEFGAEAVPYLIEGLGHDVWSVRQDCANALVVLKPLSAVGPLKTVIDDLEPGVRYEAARALGAIASPEAHQILSLALEREEDEDFAQHLRDMLGGRIH